MQKWGTSGYAEPADSTDVGDHLEDLTDGVNTVGSCYSGTTDPSSGASPAWGADQVGRLWLDTGVDGSVTNPVLKQWQDLTGGGSYGWRTLGLRKSARLDTPSSVTFSPAGPYTSDQAYTDLDLTSLLDAVQANTAKAVVAVQLAVRVKDTGTFSGGADAYAAFRKNGATDEQRVYCAVSGREHEQTLWVELDASEILEWTVVVASGGSPSFTLSATVIGYMEAL